MNGNNLQKNKYLSSEKVINDKYCFLTFHKLYNNILFFKNKAVL